VDPHDGIDETRARRSKRDRPEAASGSPAERHDRISRIFAAARRLEGLAREAYLTESCAGDADLRAEVESLLDQERNASLVVSDEMAALIRNAASGLLAPAQLPKSVGGYRIVRLIGEGGMGVVYESEQEKPRRRVALKVLRRGIASGDHLSGSSARSSCSPA